MTDTIEFELAGETYRATKLNVFEQFDVAFPLLPVVAGSADIVFSLLRQQQAGEVTTIADLLKLKATDTLTPLLRAIADMPKDTRDMIIKTCLRNTARKAGQGWQGVMASSGVLQYTELNDLRIIIQLIWKVVELSLLNFTLGPPETSSGEATK